jgi:hypothetical protein
MKLQRLVIPLVFAGVLSATVFGGPVGVAQNGDFKLDLHAHAGVTAAGVGLPAYPGATLFKEKGKDENSAADLGMILGNFNFQLKTVSYVTGDSPDRVLAFYRKPLSHYGEVLECDHGKPVGALTVTHSGLSCSANKADRDDKDGSFNSDSHELRAGNPHQFRIVTVEAAHEKSTRFGLVYVELPKDNEEKSK